MTELFSKSVKREALRRSDQLCEAEGHLYGLTEGQRCNAPLSKGLEFDHVLARSNGGKGTLDNCLAVCIKCHKYKTAHFDTPRAAKTVRQRDKHTGVVRPKSKWPQRKFNSGRTPNTKYIGEQMS